MATLQYRHLGGVWLIQIMADDEFTTAETWLTDTLTGLVPGGIHQGPAPEATTFPYVAFESVGALEDKGSYGSDVVASLTYRIRVVTQGEAYDPIAPAACQLRPLLDTANHPVAGGTIIRCRRLYPWKREEVYEA